LTTVGGDGGAAVGVETLLASLIGGPAFGLSAGLS
jgi:hypothetical protein